VRTVKTDFLGLGRPLTAALLLLTACGDDAPSGDTDDGSSSSTTDAATSTGVDPTTSDSTSSTSDASSSSTATTDEPSTTGTTDATTTGDDTTTGSSSTGDPAECGDGVVEGDEACDDGEETETCNADCTAAECGDGVLNETAGETCDDGGDSETCDADCTAVECGDGFVNAAAGEECDGGPGCSDACIVTCAAFAADSIAVDTSFAEAALAGTSTGIAWDGSNYWSVNGSGTSGDRIASHAPDGMTGMVYAPLLDFRSAFTMGDGTAPVYARSYSSSVLRVMTSPGVFENDVTLATAEPNLNTQSAVVWNADTSEFVALTQGVVLRWSADGTFVGVTTLEGLGMLVPEELDYPSNATMAWAQGCYLTYADGVLSAWDVAGERVDTVTLEEETFTLDSEFSVSYANGLVFLGDGTTWRGYAVW